MNIEVKIKKLDPNLPDLEYQTAGAVAFDVPVAEEVTIEPGETKFVRCGYIICPPEGYMIMLAPRGSNAKKGMAMPHSVGIFDQDFCGPEDEWRMPLRNVGKEPYTTKYGERLGQAVIVPIKRAKFVEIEEFEDKTRGGFGTTG